MNILPICLLRSPAISKVRMGQFAIFLDRICLPLLKSVQNNAIMIGVQVRIWLPGIFCFGGDPHSSMVVHWTIIGQCPVQFLPRHRSKSLEFSKIFQYACEFERMFNDHSFWLVDCLLEVRNGDHSAMSST